jgi:hypothetical protein
MAKGVRSRSQGSGILKTLFSDQQKEDGMSNQATPISEVAAPSRRVGRSVWAIVAGFLAVVILSTVTDVILHQLGIYPPLGQRMSDRLFVWATVYRTIYGIIGSYLTARLAPARPMWHAIVGAAIGMALGTAGAIATWNKDLGPHWYPIALVLEGIPCAWIGAKVREFQTK